MKPGAEVGCCMCYEKYYLIALRGSEWRVVGKKNPSFNL